MRRSLLLIFMICLMSMGAAAMTVSVDDVEAAQGSTTSVPIVVTGAEDIGSMDLVLSYDPVVLQAISADSGELGENAYIESNAANEGEMVIALADAGGINGDGAVVTVSFMVLGEEGSSSPLMLEEVSVHNLDLVELVTETEDGEFDVVAGTAPGTGIQNLALITLAVVFLAVLLRRR